MIINKIKKTIINIHIVCHKLSYTDVLKLLYIFENRRHCATSNCKIFKTQKMTFSFNNGIEKDTLPDRLTGTYRFQG